MLKPAVLVQRVAALTQDLAILRDAISTIHVGLKERTQPQDQVAHDLSVVQTGIGELYDDATRLLDGAYATTQPVEGNGGAAPAKAPRKAASARKRPPRKRR